LATSILRPLGTAEDREKKEKVRTKIRISKSEILNKFKSPKYKIQKGNQTRMNTGLTLYFLDLTEVEKGVKSAIGG